MTSPDEVVKSIRTEKPDVILHLASKSDVDFCEKEDNQKEVMRVNFLGTANVFEAAQEFGKKAVFFSTDQIWRGGWFEGQYKEHTKQTLPVNYYGTTKLAAEAAARSFGGKVIRTSYLFDSERPAISDKISCLKKGGVVEAPTFIRRSFLYTQDFVAMLSLYCRIIDKTPNVLHVSGGITVSWYDFMLELAKVYGFSQKKIVPKRFDTGKFAPRPHNGGLNTDLAQSLGIGRRDYIFGLVRMFNDKS